MDKPYEKLAKGSYYLILEQIVNYGLGTLFWIVLARLISVTEVGHVMVVMAIINTVLGFSASGAQLTLSKYIAEFNSKKMFDAARNVLNTGIKIGMIISIGAAIILALLSNQIANFYKEPTLTMLIAIASLAFLPSQTLAQCFMGAYNGLHRMKYTMLTTMMFQISRLVIAIALVGLGTLGIMVGFVLGSIIAVVIGYALFIRKLFNISAGDINIKGTLRFSGLNYLAIGLNTLAVQVNYILLGSNGFDSAALFGVSYLIIGIVSSLSLPLARTLLPTTSQEWSNNDKSELNRLINLTLRLMLVFSGFIYIVLLVMPEYVLSIFSKDYTVASNVLRMIVIAAIMNSVSILITNLLNGMGKADMVAKRALIAAPLTIVSSVVLISLFGLNGAAVSILIGSIANISINMYYLHIERSLRIQYTSLLKSAVTIAAAVVIAYYIGADAVLTLLFSIAIYVSLIIAFKITTVTEMRSLIKLTKNLL